MEAATPITPDIVVPALDGDMDDDETTTTTTFGAANDATARLDNVNPVSRKVPQPTAQAELTPDMELFLNQSASTRDDATTNKNEAASTGNGSMTSDDDDDDISKAMNNATAMELLLSQQQQEQGPEEHVDSLLSGLDRSQLEQIIRHSIPFAPTCIFGHCATSRKTVLHGKRRRRVRQLH